MKVAAIITKYKREFFTAGGKDPTASMVAELQSHRRSLWISFWVLFGVITIGTAFAAYLAATIRDPAMMKAVSAATGLSVAGGLVILRQVWTEWSKADLLVSMLVGASEQVASAIVQQLATNMSNR